MDSAIQTESIVFHGIYTAIVTPFTEEGVLDFQSLERVVAEQVRAGVNGVVACGTTGEASTLTSPEWAQLVENVRSFVPPSVKLVVGVGTNNTAESIVRAQRAFSMGVDGALTITPYYNKPSQRGLLAHFKAVANAVPELPHMLYTVPGRTGVELSPETFDALSRYDNIVALKDATADMNIGAAYVHAAAGKMNVLSGDDMSALSHWAMGGTGMVSVVTNLCPRLGVRMWALWQNGEAQKARAIFAQLLEVSRALFWDSNPVPVKLLMKELGVIASSHVRLPLVPVTDEMAQRLRALLPIIEELRGDVR